MKPARTRPSSRNWRQPSFEAEDVIPEEYRVQYRRIVTRYGADALADCE